MRKSILSTAYVFLAFSSAKFGEVILDTGTVSLSASDPTQSGRLSRANPPSDWSTVKAFPGIINPTTPYGYHVYTIVPPTQFIQISVSDFSPVTGTTLFGAAYLNPYNPASPGTNYLGDAGQSGNQFVNDPRVYQIKVTPLVPIDLLIEDTIPSGGGLGHPFRVIAEAFTDTLFTEQYMDVSSRVSVTTNGFVRNRATGLWTATMTVTNTSAQAIVGPVDVIISNLTAGDTMTNSTGVTGAPPQPYIRVSNGNINAGASVQVQITFTNPTNGFISFTPVTRAATQ